LKSFLDSFSDYLINNYSNLFEDSCIIFPTRRAGLFFQKNISQKINKTTWLPKIFTLNEFIFSYSKIKSESHLYLIAKLHKAFTGVTKFEENFDDFYYWGNVILSDFNDVDKELVNVEKLFSNLSDLKKIDNTFFEYSEEQILAIKSFWGNIDFKSKLEVKDKFIRLWENLFNVYIEFNKILDAENTGYDGKIYRNICQNFETNKNSFTAYKKIFVVGFNALSKSELLLLQYLKDLGNTEFFWDYDEFYLSDKNNEASFFISKQLKNFPPPNDFVFESAIGQQSSIKIYKTQTNIGQAKILPKLIENNLVVENTAIVLADETMLLPVLNSLPENFTDVNITMSYPVKESVSIQFVYKLFQLQKNIKIVNGEICFYLNDIISILNHKFLVKFISKTDIIDSLNSLKKIYIPTKYLPTNNILNLVFIKCESPNIYCKYISNLLNEILQSDEIFVKGSDKLEKQILYSIYRETLVLNDIITINNININKHETFLKIYKLVSDNIKVSFKGEPLSGLQIMGLLETRLLDFKTIILLSCNEGVIPVANPALSLIPHNLRVGFGLLTHQHQDSIFAYHFYHLLQRSNSLYFTCCNSQSQTEKFEPSRFLYQLKFNKEFKTEEIDVIDLPAVYNTKQINITKNEFVQSKINDYITGKLRLSPASLNTYITCKLKFYFQYILFFKKPKEVEEEFDKLMFGSIYHLSLQKLYSQFINKQVQKSNIEDILKNDIIEFTLKQSFTEIFQNNYDVEHLEGVALLNFEILKEYIIKQLKYDHNLAPFKLIALESETKIDLNFKKYNISLKGIIDRIIEKNDVLYIQDYKTGETLNKVANVENLFDDKFSLSAFRQLLLYCLAFDNKIIKPQLLTVKKGLEDINMFFYIGKNMIENFSDVKHEFLEQLELVVNDLFDYNTIFNQTNNQENCKYCDYAEICRKNETFK